MTEESQDEMPVTEVIEATTESNVALPRERKERTEKQKEALQKAREKASMKRREEAELKRKQKEIDRAILAKAREEEVAKVEQLYQEVSAQKSSEDIRHESKRKPGKRVITVTEISSDDEEEVEVKIPKRKMSQEELNYERARSKMFSYG